MYFYGMAVVLLVFIGTYTAQEYMWQSRIEIEYYFVAYFERITEFDTL